MLVDGFDWDKGNISKCQKHGLTVDEIESLFNNNPMMDVNIKHDLKEQRIQAIGKTYLNKHAFIVFTLRRRNNLLLIRPISARYMHKKEIEYYERGEE